MRNESALIIMVVDAAGGFIEGKTTLQKWLYFFSVKTNTNLGYIAHFYGPYSKTISRKLDDLISSDFLFESCRLTQHGRLIYTYALTEDGKNIAIDLKKNQQEIYQTLKEIVEICNNTVGNNVNILSWASKVYYLLREKGKEITYGEIEKIGKNLGWELSEKEIDSGVKLLSALNLAKKAA
jgi:uncharacterized protein YwgA